MEALDGNTCMSERKEQRSVRDYSFNNDALHSEDLREPESFAL